MTSSRLIVKNLPTITEQKLREVFSEKGVVTDCQLKFTPAGKFRHFAFVGFQNEQEAALAQEHFNGTFVGTSRIQVEECRPFGEESKARAWSKYSKDSSAYKRLHSGSSEPTSSSAEKLNSTSESDSSMTKKRRRKTSEGVSEDSETIEVKTEKGLPESEVSGERHQPPEKLEQDLETDFAESVAIEEKISPKKARKSLEKIPGFNLSEEQLDAVQRLDAKSSVIICGLPTNVKLKNLRQFLTPLRVKNVRIVRAETSIACVVCSKAGDVQKLLKKDGTYFGGHKIVMKSVFSLKNSAAAGETSLPLNPASLPAPEREKLDAEIERERTEKISDTGRLFIRNLSYLTTEESVEGLFSKFGQLADVTFPIDKFSGKPKGFAMVTFVFPENAVRAYSELDGSIFQGRMIHIIPGEEKPSEGNRGGAEQKRSGGKESEFQAKKREELMKSAGSGHNWNALFLGANAVADVISGKLGTKKSVLLDAGQSKTSLVVRMALGETQLVREIRDFLLEHGVALDSFSNPGAPRNKKVILVKNLPAETTEFELRKLLEPMGEIGRLILPPGGVSALVEFLHRNGAKAAFKALSYQKFKDVPLYLEWAPGDVFSNATIKEEIKLKLNEEIKFQPESEPEPAQLEETRVSSNDEQNLPAAAGRTLYVKNLNFDTTDDDLARKFAKIGTLVRATVARKRDPSRAGQSLSMGYGFLEFQHAKKAAKALKELQHCFLDGHKLELKMAQHARSDKPAAAEVGAAKKPVKVEPEKTGSKICVRNIPFQATEREISEIFATFGLLKFARLPKKMVGNGEGTHRGFGFVDFVTESDAKRAFDALCHSTHLYGRRLVLEWAQDDTNLAEMRKRTAEHFHEGDSKAKRAKIKQKITEVLEKFS